MLSPRRWNSAGLTRGRDELVRIFVAEPRRSVRTNPRTHWPGWRIDGDFALDWIALGSRTGYPDQTAALGNRGRQRRADDSEPCALRIPDTGAVDRRRRGQHGHRRAFLIRLVAHFAEYMHWYHGG